MSSSDRAAIVRRIRELLTGALSMNLGEDELRSGARLDALAGLDSLTVLELVEALETEFGITIEAERLDLETLTDLDRLAAYVAGRMASAASE